MKKTMHSVFSLNSYLMQNLSSEKTTWCFCMGIKL